MAAASVEFIGILPFECKGAIASVALWWKKWKTSFEYYILAKGITALAQKCKNCLKPCKIQDHRQMEQKTMLTNIRQCLGISMFTNISNYFGCSLVEKVENIVWILHLSKRNHCTDKEVQDIVQNLARSRTTSRCSRRQCLRISESPANTRSHFSAQLNKPYEKYVFRNLKQEEGEMVDQFITWLRRQAENGNWNEANETIHDQVIEKCR